MPFPALSEPKRLFAGFTLAELLIALAILGVIATFTIPKVLMAQSNQKYNAIAKEAASMLSGALKNYTLDGNAIQSGTSMGPLTSYLNYVAIDTTNVVDDVNSAGTVDCATEANATCLKLHNGAVMWYWHYVEFGGNARTNAIFVHLDPDGIQSSAKAINFWLYTDGKIRTEGSIETGTESSLGSKSVNASDDPAWWDDW